MSYAAGDVINFAYTGAKPERHTPAWAVQTGVLGRTGRLSLKCVLRRERRVRAGGAVA